MPIYDQFVEQGKALAPRFLTMVIPSRWLFGGRGLDEFRKEMLTDSRVRVLVDYPDSRQVFQNVDVAGGICYFLWEKDSPVSATSLNSSMVVSFPKRCAHFWRMVPRYLSGAIARSPSFGKS